MDGERRIIYRHRQVGLAAVMGLAGGAVTQVGSAVRAFRKKRRTAWLYLPLIAIYAAAMYVFSSLTVEIDEHSLQAGFARGFARRSIELAEIESAAVIQVPWYAGWGIRYSSSGWLYNVWGRRAVELHLSGGRVVSIGTDEPEALKAAVDAARSAAGV